MNIEAVPHPNLPIFGVPKAAVGDPAATAAVERKFRSENNTGITQDSFLTRAANWIGDNVGQVIDTVAEWLGPVFSLFGQDKKGYKRLHDMHMTVMAFADRFSPHFPWQEHKFAQADEVRACLLCLSPLHVRTMTPSSWIKLKRRGTAFLKVNYGEFLKALGTLSEPGAEEDLLSLCAKLARVGDAEEEDEEIDVANEFWKIAHNARLPVMAAPQGSAASSAVSFSMVEEVADVEVLHAPVDSGAPLLPPAIHIVRPAPQAFSKATAAW